MGKVQVVWWFVYNFIGVSLLSLLQRVILEFYGYVIIFKDEFFVIFVYMIVVVIYEVMKIERIVEFKVWCGVFLVILQLK